MRIFVKINNDDLYFYLQKNRNIELKKYLVIIDR